MRVVCVVLVCCDEPARLRGQLQSAEEAEEEAEAEVIRVQEMGGLCASGRGSALESLCRESGLHRKSV